MDDPGRGRVATAGLVALGLAFGAGTALATAWGDSLGDAAGLVARARAVRVERRGWDEVADTDVCGGGPVAVWMTVPVRFTIH